MTPDLQALLAAVVADPSDDVARLVYADCLEEHGNAARARFIRLQIEAGRHHPDSNARASLERQARELFEQHWVDWWGEVCAAVWLPMPVPKPSGRLERVAGWVGLRTPAGAPYETRNQSAVFVRTDHFGRHRWGFGGVVFRCGFPDTLSGFWRTHVAMDLDPLLTRWPAGAPLYSIWADGFEFGTDWHDGPHLAGLRRLSLSGENPRVLAEILTGSHAANLEDLSFGFTGRYSWDVAEFADRLSVALSAPRSRLLKRLSLSNPPGDAAIALASAAKLSGLTALSIHYWNHSGPPDGACPFAALGRSPHLANLTELSVEGIANPGECEALTEAKWTGLRKLRLSGSGIDDLSQSLDVLDASTLRVLLQARLPALEELRLRSVVLDADVIDLLVRSPLLKQLKHFWLEAVGLDSVSVANLRRLGQMFDPDRIQTFVLSVDREARGLNELRRQLGERMRVVLYWSWGAPRF